jgi:hypothetical protein
MSVSFSYLHYHGLSWVSWSRYNSSKCCRRCFINEFSNKRLHRERTYTDFPMSYVLVSLLSWIEWHMRSTCSVCNPSLRFLDRDVDFLSGPRWLILCFFCVSIMLWSHKDVLTLNRAPLISVNYCEWLWCDDPLVVLRHILRRLHSFLQLLVNALIDGNAVIFTLILDITLLLL